MIHAVRRHTYMRVVRFFVLDVCFCSKSDRLLRSSEMTLCAMYGRRPRWKIGRLSEAFGCSHVYPPRDGGSVFRAQMSGPPSLAAVIAPC